MSMAPLASYNARWGTKLGIDLKVTTTTIGIVIIYTYILTAVDRTRIII